MNWDQFKSSLCYPCLRGTVVASLPLTKEVVGSNIIFTARVRSTREGTVFTGVCLSTFRGGTYLPGGGGVPTQLWMGGYLPWLGWGVPTLARVGRVPTLAGVGGGTYSALDGGVPTLAGGVPTLAGGVPTLAGGTYQGRYPPT